MQVVGFAAGPLQTNCYIISPSDSTSNIASDGIRDAAPCIIVDPGMGSAQAVVKTCEEKNWVPEAIVLTHGHIDHIRDAGELAATYDVPVFVHDADRMIVVQPELGVDGQLAAMFQVSDMQVPEEIRSLEVDTEWKTAGLTLTAQHAPGHSPGCVVIRVSDGAQQLLLSGDVLFAGAIGRTDLPGGSKEDMARSLREVIMPLEDELDVLPGHGSTTTMAYEKQHNVYLRALKNAR